jgi:hypothetical protein
MSSSKYTNRLDADKKRKEEKKKSLANGGGPFAKIFIFLIKDIFIDIVLTTFYNNRFVVILFFNLKFSGLI